MTWLPEPSRAAVAEALRAVAPGLSGLPVSIPHLTGGDDPTWHMTSATLGEDYIVKFAWSQPAARFILHQIRVLEALAREPAVPFLPEVAASGTDPLILVTRRVRGSSLFKVAGSIDRDHAGLQLARFLAALHGDEARRRVEAAVGAIPAWYPLAATSALRERLGRWVTPEQQRNVVRWCDWADEILAAPGPQVLVHGDLHGDNQVWDGGDLKAVLDFETAGAGEPEYELRAFPGPGTGPGLELLAAVMRHYERFTGREVSVERVMAWHVRQALGDVLWRSEAGLPLPDRRAPGDWIADLSARFRLLGGQGARLALPREPTRSRDAEGCRAGVPFGFLGRGQQRPRRPRHGRTRPPPARRLNPVPCRKSRLTRRAVSFSRLAGRCAACSGSGAARGRPAACGCAQRSRPAAARGRRR